MKEKTFYTYFSLCFVGILLLGNLLSFYLWNKLGMNGVLAAMTITALLAGFAFTHLANVKIEDKNGKQKQLSDIIGGVVGLLVVFIVASLVITGSASFIGYRKHRMVGVAVPVSVLFVTLLMLGIAIHFS